MAGNCCQLLLHRAMASSMADSPNPEIFLSPHSDMSPQHHLKKKLSLRIQC